jgi:hypothetical protein
MVAKLEFIEHDGIIEGSRGFSSARGSAKKGPEDLLPGRTSFETRVKSRGKLLFFVGEVSAAQVRQADQAAAQEQQRPRRCGRVTMGQLRKRSRKKQQ